MSDVGTDEAAQPQECTFVCFDFDLGGRTSGEAFATTAEGEWWFASEVNGSKRTIMKERLEEFPEQNLKIHSAGSQTGRSLVSARNF